VNLVPRRDRLPMDKLLDELRRETRKVPGVNVYFSPIQNLRLGGRISKARYQYVLRSVGEGELQEAADKMVTLMKADPLFRDTNSDAQLKGLQAQLNIDRDKANALGVQMQDIRTALYSTFGERQVSTIYTPTDSYQVILQGAEADRRDESAFGKIYVRARSGNLVPLSSVATVERKVGPHRHQPPGPAPGDHHLVQPGARRLARRRHEEARPVPRADPHARQHPHRLRRRRGGVPGLADLPGELLLVAALLVIYVLLGVLYESYIHPLTILAGLPRPRSGALVDAVDLRHRTSR
jgi:HAE1 family hydrophobic/amphiphilic exporter-1